MKTSILIFVILFSVLAGCAVAPRDPGRDTTTDSGYVIPYDYNADRDPPYNGEIVTHKVGEPGGFR